MDKNNVIALERRVIGTDPLTELLKDGARCTSSKHMAPLELFSKRYFSAHAFSSLVC
jgi:hypothetical protein